MTEQVETVVDPALAAGNVVDPPIDPPPVENEAPPAPQPRMIPADILIREVTPLRGQLRQTENDLAEARRRLAAQDELLARLQRGGNGADPAATPPQPRQDRAPDPNDIDRRAAELLFQRDAQAISNAAAQAYGPQWGQSLAILDAVQLNTGDFVGSVMEVVGREKTHEIMHAIAQEPEKAAALASMSPARRIAEITRMSAKMTDKPAAAAPAAPVPPPRTVSRAPAPPPPVEPSASRVVDGYSDDATDEQFTEQFNRRMRERNARR